MSLIGIIVYLYLFREPLIKTIPLHHYHTDTLRIPDPYPVPVPYFDSVPPRILKIYEKDSLAIDSLKLLLSEKDIIIQGLYSQITISQDFLKQFPKNPKLLELNISSDSLSISTLQISGIPYKYDYPIYLSDFNYKWALDGLTKTKTNNKEVKQKLFQYFVDGGFSFFHKSPYVGFTIEKDWARVTLYADVKGILLKTNGFDTNIGVKYNIRKNAPY